MGYYINPPEGWSDTKTVYLFELGAVEVSRNEAMDKVDSHGVIVWVDNGLFDATGWAFNKAEFEAFTHPHDRRPKRYFILPREVAEREAK